MGVLSGVLTAVLLWLIGVLFTKVLIPWYQNFVYQGGHVDGTWAGFYKEGDPPACRVSLRQKGHKISGEILLHRQPDGEETIKAFVCRGVLKDRNLILTYKPKDKRQLGSGAILMTLTNDGNRFEGKSLYFGSVDNKVESLKEYWIRGSGVAG